jgi:hypothetical protein
VKKPVSKFAFQMRPAALHRGQEPHAAVGHHRLQLHHGHAWVSDSAGRVAAAGGEGAHAPLGVHLRWGSTSGESSLTHGLKAPGFNP